MLQAFLDHITFMTSRKNTVNGKVYSQDATIFSWNLMVGVFACNAGICLV